MLILFPKLIEIDNEKDNKNIFNKIFKSKIFIILTILFLTVLIMNKILIFALSI